MNYYIKLEAIKFTYKCFIYKFDPNSYTAELVYEHDNRDKVWKWYKSKKSDYRYNDYEDGSILNEETMFCKIYDAIRGNSEAKHVFKCDVLTEDELEQFIFFENL